jgi:hypothetical protein
MSENYIISCYKNIFSFHLQYHARKFIYNSTVSLLTLNAYPQTRHLKAQLHDSASHTLILDKPHTKTLMKP